MELLEALTPVIVTGIIDGRRFDRQPGIIEALWPSTHNEDIHRARPYYIKFNDGSSSWWCPPWAVALRFSKIR